MNLKSHIIPTFCPGCNNFLLFAGIQQAIEQLQIPKENLVLVFDIGCIGNMADFFSTYGIHSLHGRCIPTAIGVKLANPKLIVIAIGGDGGGQLQGAGRFDQREGALVEHGFAAPEVDKRVVAVGRQIPQNFQVAF